MTSVKVKYLSPSLVEQKMDNIVHIRNNRNITFLLNPGINNLIYNILKTLTIVAISFTNKSERSRNL